MAKPPNLLYSPSLLSVNVKHRLQSSQRPPICQPPHSCHLALPIFSASSSSSSPVKQISKHYFRVVVLKMALYLLLLNPSSGSAVSETGGRAFSAKDFTTSQILHAWSRGGQRFGLVGLDHPVIIQARHTAAAPSGPLVRCHQQNFYMLWLGDNYRDFKRGLPPEQSRDDSARRKVSSPFFLLFLAPHPCPPTPSPIKEYFDIHQRRNLAPALELPPSDMF